MLKIEQNIFFDKKVFGSKVAPDVPQMRFLSFFCMKLQQHKGLTLTHICESLTLRFLERKWPEMWFLSSMAN